VNQGCCAEFEIRGGGGGYYPPVPPPSNEVLVSCDSIGGKFNSCSAGGRRITNAILQKQNSNTACVLGSTWGFDNSYVWVDKGCRGVFRVSTW
jgi:hypothetical protein